MVNRQRKILKYIYKNPGITRSAILRQFPDFAEYEFTFSEYISVKDNYVDPEKEWEDKLYNEAIKLGIPYNDRREYIDSHMPKDKITSVPDPDDHKFYSTNLAFQEYLEKRRHEAVLFWIPYGLTTLIAALSVIFEILNFILGN